MGLMDQMAKKGKQKADVLEGDNQPQGEGITATRHPEDPETKTNRQEPEPKQTMPPQARKKVDPKSTTNLRQPKRYINQKASKRKPGTRVTDGHKDIRIAFRNLLDKKENRDKHTQEEKENQAQKSRETSIERKQKQEAIEKEKERETKTRAKAEETHKHTDIPLTQRLRPPPTSVVTARRQKLTQKPHRGKRANLEQSTTENIHNYFKRVPGLRENNARGLDKYYKLESNSDIRPRHRPRPIPKGGPEELRQGPTPED